MTPTDLDAIESRANAAERGDDDGDAMEDWQIEPKEVLGLVAEVRRLQAELGDQQYHHAACLSIAEGAPGWQEFEAKYEAARAVKKLRARIAEAEALLRDHYEHFDAMGYSIEREAIAAFLRGGVR